MSFAREMGNVVTTGVGTLLPFLALLHQKTHNKWGASAILATSALGGYLGNKIVKDKSPDQMKETIRNRAVSMLEGKGISEEEIKQKFDQYYEAAPLKIGFGRNFGNQITTLLGSAVGLFGGAVLGDKIAGGGFQMRFAFSEEEAALIRDELGRQEKKSLAIGIPIAIAGTLLGGYLGNKAWQGPSKSAVDERALDIVSKILAERKPVANMSQVEALQHREQTRTQSAEQVR